MDKPFGKILCIDGSYALHRSLHVPEIFDLKNSKGDRTGGIFGFLKTLNHELKTCSGYFPIVTFDEGLAKRRTNADPNYKRAQERRLQENVVLTPEELNDDYVTQYKRQRNKLIELLSYFGVPCLKFIGWEGDDLMYIISNMSDECIVLTDDRDMLQLLSDSTSVRRPMANELWNLSSFLESREFDIIYDFVLYKAIRGDGSDNIPGSCKGIGDASVNEFIKLLYTFRMSSTEDIWDFSNYPKSEDLMRAHCKIHDIKYKKAYLNFDPERFLTNLELVDLCKVDIDERVYKSIKSVTERCKSDIDYFKVVQMMSELEIRDFSIDELMQNVSTRYHNLFNKGDKS